MGSGLPRLENARQLKQERLAVLGRWLFILAIGFSAGVAVLTVLVDDPALVGPMTAPTILFIDAVAALLWILAAVGTRSRSSLILLDVGAMALLGIGFGLVAAHTADAGAPIVGPVFATVLTAILRATIVPGRALGAVALAAMCVGPAVAMAGPVSVGVGLMAASGIAAAGICSRVAFGETSGRLSRDFGQYVLQEKIGEGGMGVVFRARHAMLRRPTAIKLLHDASELSVERFEREVQFTAQLSHPNTVAIYDFGRTPDGVFYYAMEFLEGINLFDLVRIDGAQSAGRTIRIMRQVADSLAEAHSFKLIHRDIKPANVLLCERGGKPDVAKVVDFGLVKSIDPDPHSSAGQTGSHLLVGTPMYLSPEAIEAPETIDARSDLYALGAVGYFLLTGHAVFEADSVVEVCADHLTSLPVPPSQRTAEPIPNDLERIIMRCLEKDRERRFLTARSLGRALDRCADAHTWTRELASAWWRRYRDSEPTHRAA